MVDCGLGARHLAKPLMSRISLNLHSNPAWEEGIIVITILQIRKLRPGDVKPSALPQGTRAEGVGKKGWYGIKFYTIIKPTT